MLFVYLAFENTMSSSRGITPNETQLCSLLRALFGEEGQERDRQKARLGEGVGL